MGIVSDLSLEKYEGGYRQSGRTSWCLGVGMYPLGVASFDGASFLLWYTPWLLGT